MGAGGGCTGRIASPKLVYFWAKISLNIKNFFYRNCDLIFASLSFSGINAVNIRLDVFFHYLEKLGWKFS